MNRRILWKSVFIGTLAIAGIIFVRIYFFSKAESALPAARSKAATVRVVQAARESISLGLDLTGSVEPYRTAHLASPAEGPVRDLRVREGDRVAVGDALLAIGRKKGIDAQIISLQQELKKEKENLQRVHQLVALDALPGEQLDQAKASFEGVRAQLVGAEETARDYAITAPWNGVISSVLVKDGEFISPRTLLLEMYDPSSLVIRAAVPEKYAVRMNDGMAVSIHLDAWPDQLIQGRIDRVYPYLDDRLRTRTLEIGVDEPGKLLPGMFARLKIVLETIDEAVTVPVEALVATPTGPKIFLALNGKAISRPVKTGIEADNRIQIVAGVQPGDPVIVAGNENLKDNAAVRLADQGLPTDTQPLSMIPSSAAQKIPTGAKGQ